MIILNKFDIIQLLLSHPKVDINITLKIKLYDTVFERYDIEAYEDDDEELNYLLYLNFKINFIIHFNHNVFHYISL